jgi:Transglycosylase SLT domain
MRPIAVVVILAHLVAACPAPAQNPEAAANSTQDTYPAAPPSLDTKAHPDPDQNSQKPNDLRFLCQTLAAAAAQNGLPFEFFSRIIWQESRFDSSAIGPVTRGGQRAQGIAQFMPATASERSLGDPFDPSAALPKSAEFLRELQTQFGNLGLAAAAYNAGPQRVRDWLDGKRSLPPETLSYVQIVTGHSAQEWRLTKSTVLAIAAPAEMSCAGSAVLRQKSPSAAARAPAKLAWVAQLIGDSSETAALSRFRQMQGKLRFLLGSFEPALVRTTLKAGGPPIWVRVRIEFETRQAAESLCSKLEGAGVPCLIQRNLDEAPNSGSTAKTQTN